MTSPPSVPFPPHGGYVAAVRSSSRAARLAANIKIEPSAVERLLLSPAFTSTFSRLSTTHGLAFPFKFPSALSELNFLSILSLLNFLSGYRGALHAITGRGAYDTVRAFMFTSYITSSNGDGGGGAADPLSARGMQAITEQAVAELTGLSMHEERPHESIPGVIVGELGGPGYEIVKLLTQAMNSTGEVLVAGGYKDLGSFVLEALREGQKVQVQKGSEAGVDAVLERLVRAFPALQDMVEVGGQPVYCFKKALILIFGVAHRFRSSPSSWSAPIPLPDTSNLPIFADNVIPSMLVHLGVVDLSASSPSLGLADLFPGAGSDELLPTLLAEAPKSSASEKPAAKTSPKDGPALTIDQAFVLRAAAIDACELIVEAARSLDVDTEGKVGSGVEWLKEITPPEVDAWLWAVAKDRPDYRSLERFVLKDTVFF